MWGRKKVAMVHAARRPQEREVDRAAEKAPHATARGVRRRQGSHHAERRVGVYRPPPKWRGSPVSKHPVREQ
jgi:hypothetical protein